ncbi:hypothetical protein EYZ11_008604 [Aspergillus tanneri]|uniref:Uncharacterized protein n=1 Tax=Aspergillus tanneri TaxID=1220188 RepID=A0A4S3JA35_9EURO|nr:hypothetical protein EYZ11_008604 [Aspergillus tanneri]
MNQLDDVDPIAISYGKKHLQPPRVGFVFTGQGAQWPEMGRDLLKFFAPAKEVIGHLDAVLQRLPDPPNWTLLDELTEPRDPKHIRQPEFSQPLVTALQIALLVVLKHWGVWAQTVVGHSSGEIAAAYAAGYLSDEEAILLAYHRGQSCQDTQLQKSLSLGMLAVGLGPDEISNYLCDSNDVELACRNSPTNVTLSGTVEALEQLKQKLEKNGSFARMLQVDLAYHSTYMHEIGEAYKEAVSRDLPMVSSPDPVSDDVVMYSSVSGHMQVKMPDVDYWKNNMISPVRFSDAVGELLASKEPPNYLIEIGPSGALKGPVSQILNALGSTNIKYIPALHRGEGAINSTLGVAGELYLAGAPIRMELVNEDSQPLYPLTLIDLPNYCWDHSDKYWFESPASEDWRFRPFPHHDLLGSKVLGTPWYNPTFKKTMSLTHLPWLRDHRLGSDVIFPGSAYVAMAVEAIYQVASVRQPNAMVSSSGDLGYRLRNVRFDMALVLEDGDEPDVYLTMNPFPGSKESWYEFKVFSIRQGVTSHHANGMIRVHEPVVDPAPREDIAPLEHPSPGHLWTKAFAELGFNYGPAFHLLQEVENRTGMRRSRCTITLAEPVSDHESQSHYPFHPAALDGVFRATTPASVAGKRGAIRETLIPAMVDDFIINPNPNRPDVGIAVSSSYYSGRGRKDAAKSYLGDTTVYNPATGDLLIRMTKLASHKINLGVDPLSLQTLTHEVFKPDISTLSQESIQKLGTYYEDHVSGILELAAHRKPGLDVLEIDLDTGDLESPWLDWQHKTESQAGKSYRFMALDSASIADVKCQYDHYADDSFQVLNPEETRLGLDAEVVFDLIILKCVSPLSDRASSVVEKASSLLSTDGHILALELSAPGRQINSKRSLRGKLTGLGFRKVLSVPGKMGTIFLCSASPPRTQNVETAATLHSVVFGDGGYIPPVTRENLQRAGWQVNEHQCPDESVPEGATVLVIDEVFSSLLTHISEAQWIYLRRSRDLDQATPHILTVLDQLRQPQARWISDSEYVERDGILHIPRVVPFGPLAHEVKEHIAKPIPKLLSENEPLTQLRAEYVEGHVEIEVCAAGLNFKDVAVTMGIVPENEHLLGLEGSGIVRRTGPGVGEHLCPGTHTVFMAKGALANRIYVPKEFTVPIPHTMPFHEAATMPVVFCTALYSLFNTGNLQRGQSVLIHSAAGGVGMACIQLAKYAGADIYVTVGTEQKRHTLHKKFGIPYEHATWRICADGGTMVEIGKRDIVERNYLAMEPFDRGCSYRPIDLSHPIGLQKLPVLLKRVFELLADSHITPITPITTFSMSQVPEAFAYLRSGRHVGKVVICDKPEEESKVLIRPLQRDISLREGVAYLIVGGLKGLCGSLAVHLAQRGARHLVVLCRSGCEDSRSQKVILNCRSLDCKVHVCRGDVLRTLDVRRAFMRAPVPVGGVVQGAMLLRDRPYEMMTVDEYHQSIEGKVQGTWNLHHVSLERGQALDFFLLLSSISSVVGSKGQANYAAANSFLDSFAAYRRSMGLAAQTINLGVVEDVGVVAESDELSKRHQGSNELTNIPEGVLHDIVDCSLHQQFSSNELSLCADKDKHPTVPPRLITGLRVPQDPRQSGLRFDPRFRGLFMGRSTAFETGTGASDGDILGSAVHAFHTLVRSGAVGEQLLESCVQVLATRLGQMLRWGEDQQIEPERPLSVYGLDSLSTVELRNWVKAQMGAELTTFDIVHANSLIMLAERLLSKMRRE